MNGLKLIKLSQFFESGLRIEMDEHSVVDDDLLTFATENKFEELLQPWVERLARRSIEVEINGVNQRVRP